jgi:dinuclear metal center YbgI/SA1388 family protein
MDPGRGQPGPNRITPVDIHQLVEHCNRLLEVERFTDYCPNGLQVEVRSGVGLLVTGVSASQALIDAAADAGAGTLLVHHGFFWKGESPCLTGMKGRRVAALVRSGINLLAYHLPLDAHPALGNNACLGEVLGVAGEPVDESGSGLLWHARLPLALALSDLAQRVEKALGRTPLTVAGGDRRVRHLAWCTGAAQGYIDQAAALGCDAYISGEVSEQTVHQARELGIHYLAAGHHATERYGVAALGAHLAERFGIEHRHLDIDNPA